ncbi:MAG TPA: hypothetical protein VMW48_09170 [Vicinamibacterales bacterium]|nr:hypothetical protein [Vicinamibacterales bacterium]
MRSPSVLGLLAGVAAAGLSIADNLHRDDPSLVHLAPDLAGLLVIAGLVATAIIGAAWLNPDTARRDAWHAAFVSAGAFAVTMAAFTRFYLPESGPLPGSVMALAGIILTSLGGAVAGRDVARGARHA